MYYLYPEMLQLNFTCKCSEFQVLSLEKKKKKNVFTATCFLSSFIKESVNTLKCGPYTHQRLQTKLTSCFNSQKNENPTREKCSTCM